MSTIAMTPQLKTVGEIFQTTLLEVPRYQRPYSWGSENLAEFISDVTEYHDEGYFIGPMVVYRNGDRYSIVDGQQRLTTIALLLSSIRDRFAELGEANLAGAVHNFIETTDQAGVSNYVLRSEAAGSHLFGNHLARERGARVSPTNEDQRNIDASARAIHAELDEIVDAARHGEDDADNDLALAALSDLRRRILGLLVIWFPLDTEDRAYRIFETLNSRGKNLDTIDLVKNLVLEGLPPENADHDSRAEEWRAVRRTLEEDGNGVSPNIFILHWWLSRAEYTAEKNVFRRIREVVRNDALPRSDLLGELRSNATLYAKIVNPRHANWDAGLAEVRNSIGALAEFGVRQPRPLLLSAMRAYEDKRLSARNLRSLLRGVESFHYVTTMVMQLSSSGGVSKMYASWAKKMHESMSSNDTGRIVTEVLRSLREKIPEEGFEAAFVERLRYSRAEVSQKELVFYTLRRLQATLRPKHPLDPERSNVEHIEPQSGGALWASEIGNLVLVPTKVNDDLGTKSFVEKRDILSAHAGELVLGEICEKGSWGEKEVRDRGLWLAGEARRAWSF